MHSIDDELRASIETHARAVRVMPAEDIAFKCGLPFDAEAKTFTVDVFGHAHTVKFPSLRITHAGDPTFEASTWIQNLIVLYFAYATGATLTGRWISFRDLPDGMFYWRSFQNFGGNAVAQHFGNDLERLQIAATPLGGQPAQFGDGAFVFQALARVPLLLIYWRSGTGLPATSHILFDESASQYLPTGSLAILGGRLARFLIDGRDDGRKALI